MEIPEENLPRRSQEFPPTPESVGEVFEHAIREGKEVGEGKDGIVFRIDLASLSESEISILKDEGAITETADKEGVIASKILKLYRPELGDHEFRMQRKAREILSKVSETCLVPEVSVATNQEISEETKSFLNLRGAELERRAEIIMMDYVDGDDLGTLTYNFVLEQNGYEDEYISSISYSEKEQQVGHILGFVVPDPEAGTPEEKRSAQSIAFERNETILLAYLRKSGFKLDPEIISKIERTVRVLHENGIYHNDLHKRNIMISRGGEVFMIDFGRAGNSTREDGLDDTLFAKYWKRLTVSKQEEQEDLIRKEFSSLEKRFLASEQKIKELESLILALKSKGVGGVLAREFSKASVDASKFDQFLVALHLVQNSSELEAEKKAEISEFVGRMISSNMITYQKSRVIRLREIGYIESV